MRRVRLGMLGLLAVVGLACTHARGRVVRGPEDALVAASEPISLRDDGDPQSLRAALEESVTWLATQPPDRSLVFGPRRVLASELSAQLQALIDALPAAASPEALEGWVRAHFDVLEAAGGDDGSVLFTGYYEPVLEASLTPSKDYPVPVYSAPKDIIEVSLSAFGDRYPDATLVGRLEGNQVVPYWDRSEIEAGKLKGRGLELAWLKDPVGLFFLQVQGSGVLELPDGTERRIGYAAQNGRPYTSIGGVLIDRGAIARDEMSMQALKVWLATHPGEQDALLDQDQSYVFFRFLDGAALGSLGRPVTAGRSIATDARLFPPGALAFIQTERPAKGPDGQLQWIPLHRFVLNQDTGGAIRGAGHVDVFWGRGEDAELAAGLMKQQGRLVFLVPKITPQPIPPLAR